PPDRRRPQRPHRLPHQHDARVVLPVQGRHDPQGRRPGRRRLQGHRHPRGRHVPAARQHAAQPRPLRRHGRRRARAAPAAGEPRPHALVL
ncbi:hypothetical protein BN1708_020498, partial [Verticillium longisporum]